VTILLRVAQVLLLLVAVEHWPGEWAFAIRGLSAAAFASLIVHEARRHP